MCPASLRTLHTGKEGFPTIAYNVSCDHKGNAFFVTAGTYGSCNDKTIIRFDRHIDIVRSSPSRHLTLLRLSDCRLSSGHTLCSPMQSTHLKSRRTKKSQLGASTLSSTVVITNGSQPCLLRGKFQGTTLAYNMRFTLDK